MPICFGLAIAMVARIILSLSGVECIKGGFVTFWHHRSFRTEQSGDGRTPPLRSAPSKPFHLITVMGSDGRVEAASQPEVCVYSSTGVIFHGGWRLQSILHTSCAPASNYTRRLDIPIPSVRCNIYVCMMYGCILHTYVHALTHTHAHHTQTTHQPKHTPYPHRCPHTPSIHIIHTLSLANTHT